jgi:heptosyltransferase I
MRYLIVKTSAFGDVVQAFPVLQYLKSVAPDCEISWVVEKKIAHLVRAHPLVDHVIEVDAKEWKKKLLLFSTWRAIFGFIKHLRNQKYEAVFDLQGNIKSALITLFTKAKAKVGFGWKSAPERVGSIFLNVRANPPKGQNIRRDYLFLVQSYFHDFTTRPCEKLQFTLSEEEEALFYEMQVKLSANSWMICPHSIWRNKRLPKQRVEEFLKEVEARYGPQFVFLAGSLSESERAYELESLFPSSLVLDRLPLPVVQHLMATVQLVVSVDSLPLHLAGTTNTPTFSLFGPSKSCKYRPLGNQHFSFQGSCPYGRTFEKRCPILRTCPTGSCLRDVPSKTLFAAFSSWWDQYQETKR